MDPYGVQPLSTIHHQPQHIDVVETLVVLASLLEPEDPELLHELIEDYPELVSVPAETLLRTYDSLQPLPDCYNDLDAVLLAARTARVLPASHIQKLARLTHVFYDVLNSPLPPSLVYTLGPASPVHTFCGRVRRLATILRPHAALAALEEHPGLLDYDSSDLENRIDLLADVLHLSTDQATKAVGKAPAVLMMTPAIIYQRLDDLAERFSLTFNDMKELFLGEPKILIQDLDVLTMKWKALISVCADVPVWEEEVDEQRAKFLVQLARCNIKMLQRLTYEIADGSRVGGETSLLDLIYLERQYWRSRSPPAIRRMP